MSKISWTHYFSWTLRCSVWSLVQQSTINCTEVKTQNTRFDESDGPVAKIVKGWKKMFLCWCQQKFVMRGGRQRSRGRCTCRCSHSETIKKNKKTSATVWESLLRINRKLWLSFSHPHTQTVRQGFLLVYQTLHYILILTFHLQCQCTTFPWNIIPVIGFVFKAMHGNSFYSDTKPATVLQMKVAGKTDNK